MYIHIYIYIFISTHILYISLPHQSAQCGRNRCPGLREFRMQSIRQLVHLGGLKLGGRGCENPSDHRKTLGKP